MWNLNINQHIEIPNNQCMVYLPTFTINISQMWVNIPDIDDIWVLKSLKEVERQPEDGKNMDLKMLEFKKAS